MIRVAITGPESSGKSELAKALAIHFSTAHSIEYARTYLTEKGGGYDIEDLDLICEGQLEEEENAEEAANRLVFFDTDMLVLKIWSEFRFGKVSKRIQQAYDKADYDLTLLCKPDLPWTPDHLRESPKQSERDELFELYKEALVKRNQPYTVISGAGESRLDLGIQAVLHLLKR